MLGITIFIYNCLHKFITRNVFLRLLAFFCWITWNWSAIFVHIRSCHFFVDVFSITIRQFLGFDEAVTRNLSFWLFTIKSWISWDFLTFFVHKLSDWTNSWCVGCRGFGSIHIFTNHCHCWCSSCEFRFWCEGYSAVCCYCVSTNTWDGLGC